MTPQQFKRIRLSLNYTQKKIGDRLGLEERQIKRYEAGDGEIPRMVAEIMEYLISAKP